MKYFIIMLLVLFIGCSGTSDKVKGTVDSYLSNLSVNQIFNKAECFLVVRVYNDNTAIRLSNGLKSSDGMCTKYFVESEEYSMWYITVRNEDNKIVSIWCKE